MNHQQHHNQQHNTHHNKSHDGYSDQDGRQTFGGLEDGEQEQYTGGNVIYDWKHGRPLYALIEGAVIILLLFCLMYSVFGSSPSGWLVALSLVATGLYFVVELVPNFNSKTDEWNAALSAKLSNN